MDKEMDVQRFFDTLAKILSAREGVDIKAKVRRVEDIPADAADTKPQSA